MRSQKRTFPRHGRLAAQRPCTNPLRGIGNRYEMIGAVLLEANDEWQTQNRYMQIEGMVELMAPAIDADTPRISTVAA